MRQHDAFLPLLLLRLDVCAANANAQSLLCKLPIVIQCSNLCSGLVPSGDLCYYGRAAASCCSVCVVADIIGKPEGFLSIKKCLTFRHRVGRENAPARASCRAHRPHSSRQSVNVLPRSVLLGRAAIFGHEEDYGFKNGPRAGRSLL
jgi:hypothetical protein